MTMTMMLMDDEDDYDDDCIVYDCHLGTSSYVDNDD